MSNDVISTFDQAKSGAIPGGHNYGNGHSDYNKAVREMWENGIKGGLINPATMTPSEAQDFIRKVIASNDPRISRFNQKIYQKIVTNRLQKVLRKKAMGPIVGGIYAICTADSLEDALGEMIDSAVWGMGELN